MELNRRSLMVYVSLAAIWGLVVGWQIEEHIRVRELAKSNLRNRAKDAANLIGSCIKGMQFHAHLFRTQLQPALDVMVSGPTNELGVANELISIVLLNAAGDQLASAGSPIDLNLVQQDLQQAGERWGRRTMTAVFPIEGVPVNREGITNAAAPVLLEPPTNNIRGRFPRRGEPRPPPPGEGGPPPPPDRERADAGGRASSLDGPEGPPREGQHRPRLPFWAVNAGFTETTFQSFIQKREMHGLVLAFSTDNLQAVRRHDMWLRSIILFFATVSAVGSGVAWRSLDKSSDLQIRLVRASELNTHLKEMNLAAAGLAHETRNPLNIIRGLAQMISKQPEGAAEIQIKTREIIDEADKVAAQLNEFMNYSRPREVRRSRLLLGSVVNEVVRALNYDLDEKKIRLELKVAQLHVEADEQLLRQALFNLLLNAIQAVDTAGQIEICADRRHAAEAVLEIRDDGPGVPPERRLEIFKPYFTTQKKGTGLGLAVVQQIVLAHGWEVECLSNEPKGALFRITHLKVVERV